MLQLAIILLATAFQCPCFAYKHGQFLIPKLFMDNRSPTLKSKMGVRLRVFENGPLDSNNAPYALDSLAQGFSSGFESGFQSKFFGVLLGNIAAGFVVKYISDYILNLVRSKGQERFDQSQLITENVKNNPRQEISLNSWLQLVFCVFIDVAGDSSFLIPGLGELEDVVWAPISAFTLSKLFGSTSVTTIDFVKEILPGFDVIPVASLAWLLQNFYPTSPLTRALNIKSPSEISQKGNESIKNEL